MTKGQRPHLFYWSRDGGGAIGLGLLMLAAALTEGLGIVLLVPMLALLGGAGEGGTIARVLAGMGIPQRLDVLLCLFVALAALRALLTHARSQASVHFEVSLVDALRSRAWHAVLNCEWRTLSEMRRADTASLLITEIDRSAIAVNQAIQAIAQGTIPITIISRWSLRSK